MAVVISVPRFGSLEAAVMERMWACDRPVSVRDVLARLDRQLAYTTVQTVMEALHRKGWLHRRRDGRANLYSVAATREDYVSALLGEALDQAADRPAALLRLVETLDAPDAERVRHALWTAGRAQR